MKKVEIENVIKEGTYKEKALLLHKAGTGKIKLTEEQKKRINNSVSKEDEEQFNFRLIHSLTYRDFYSIFSTVYMSFMSSLLTLRNLLQIVHDEDRIINNLIRFENAIKKEIKDKETQQIILKTLQKNTPFETMNLVLEDGKLIGEYHDIREKFKEHIEKTTDDLAGLKACILALQFYAEQTDTEDMFLFTYGDLIEIVKQDWAEDYYDGEFSEKRLNEIIQKNFESKIKTPVSPDLAVKGVIPYYDAIEPNTDYIETFFKTIIKSQGKFL